MTGKELRLLRLAQRISRGRIAFWMTLSPVRVQQIEAKLYVRESTIRRYMVALDGAVKYRGMLKKTDLPKSRKKNAEAIDASLFDRT